MNRRSFLSRLGLGAAAGLLGAGIAASAAHADGEGWGGAVEPPKQDDGTDEQATKPLFSRDAIIALKTGPWTQVTGGGQSPRWYYNGVLQEDK